MVQIAVTTTVAEFPRFLEGFTSRGLPLRERHGSRRAQVLRHVEDDSRVTLLFDWSSAEAFAAFLADPEVKASMQAGGTVGPPEVTVLELAADLPA